MSARHLIAVLPLMLVIGAAPAHAQGTYHFSDLSGDGYLVTDINNSGDTTGNVTSGGQRGWVRRGTQYHVLDFLPTQEPNGNTYGGQYSRATDINDSGAVVGTATNGRVGRIAGGRHAVVWRPFAEGNMTPTKVVNDLGVMASGSSECNVGPPTIDCFTEGVAINEAGDVAGRGEVGFKSGRSYYTLPFFSPGARTLLMGTGTAPSSDAVTTAGAGSLGASGVNDNDQVVVWPDPALNGVGDTYSSALYTDGARQGIPFGTRSTYHPVNNSGWVVGTIRDETGKDQAKLWRAGTATTLPPLSGDTEADALAINNNGDVVGSSSGTGCSRAVKWPANDFANPIDLTARTATTWQLTQANAINDRGDIVGAGFPTSTCSGTPSRPFKIEFPGIVVNNAGDEPDLSGGTGGCDAKSDPNDQCTLRAAIQTLNDGSARQRMSFSAPGMVITPLSPLPALERPVEMDGNLAAIDGTSAGAQAGLRIEGGDSALTAFSVRNFQGDGIHLASSDNVIGGCGQFACAAVRDNGGDGVSVATGHERNTVRGVRLSGNGGLAIDVGNDGRTANTGVATDFPVGVSEILTPARFAVSGRASTAPAGSVIDVYAQAPTGPAAHLTELVASLAPRSNGWFGVEGTGPTPSAGRFFSATVTTPDGTTSELSPVCRDTNSDNLPDGDRDGLCDEWETSGVDYDADGSIDLPLPDADPGRPDVFYEADTMEDDGGLTARPDGAIFAPVKEAFANAPTPVGLHLTKDGIDETVPAQRALSLETAGPGSLLGIRNGTDADPCDGSFGTASERSGDDCWKTIGAKRLTHRYALFGYRWLEADPPDAGGGSVVGSDSLLVSLGEWDNRAFLTQGGHPSRCSSPATCRRNVETATLMHELGHTLGLRHGGSDNDNFKPNYLSIMNYSFELQGFVPNRVLDFSREQLPTLDEKALVEWDGIGATAATQQRWPATLIATKEVGDSCDPEGADRVGVNAFGPIDFNRDEDWDDTVVDRVITGSCDGQLLAMPGHDDWSNLRYSFRGTLDALNAGAGSDELGAAEAVAMAANTDVDGDGISNLDESCTLAPGSGFADVNGNQVADACETLPAPTATASPAPPAGPGTSPSPSPSPSPAADKVAPRLTLAKLAQKGRKLTFTLSEAAAVKVTTAKLVAGRRKGKRCVAGRKKGKRCTVRRAAGSTTAAGVAGANTVALPKVRAGRYRVTVVATDAAGNPATPVTLSLRVGK